jgi:hypothetical protein
MPFFPLYLFTVKGDVYIYIRLWAVRLKRQIYGFFERVLQLDGTAVFKWNLCSVSCCIMQAFVWQRKYGFQQHIIKICNYQSEVFALASVSVSVLNDPMLQFNRKISQFARDGVGFIYVCRSRTIPFKCIYFSFYSTLRQCLVQVGSTVLKHLLPHPQHGHGRGRGYVKQSVD